MELKTELQNHQVRAVEKLSRIKIGALYMEMGTGKSRTAIELAFSRIKKGKVNKVLWLCPCSVKPTIEAELTKHIEGDTSNIIIAGIESLSSSIRLNLTLLNLVQKHKVFLIVDESNLVKNHRAKRTENIMRLAGYCQYKLILNGTPISKSEADLYAQWHILDWRILGYKSYWSFAANHLEYDEKVKGKIRRVLNVNYLVEKIAPYTFQVKKEECLDLPPKSYSSVYCELTEYQREAYEQIKEDFLSQIDEFEPSTIYRLFAALQHVVSGRVVTTRASKKMQTAPVFDTPMDNPRIQTLLSIIERTDKKIIIWCKYTHEIKDISEVLAKEYGEESVVKFYGEVSKKQRSANAKKFASDARFFVANKTCAGYGLNLQFCSYMIYYSNDWDWATRIQSEDRAHRMGQDKNVHIVDIYATQTLDVRILECLERKEKLVDRFKNQIEKMKNETDLRKWIDGEGLGLD